MEKEEYKWVMERKIKIMVMLNWVKMKRRKMKKELNWERGIRSRKWWRRRGRRLKVSNMILKEMIKEGRYRWEIKGKREK